MRILLLLVALCLATVTACGAEDTTDPAPITDEQNGGLGDRNDAPNAEDENEDTNDAAQEEEPEAGEPEPNEPEAGEPEAGEPEPEEVDPVEPNDDIEEPPAEPMSGSSSRPSGERPTAEDLNVEALMAENNIIIIDVRTLDEFMTGHIPGAINVPIQEFESVFEILGDDFDRPIITYGTSGVRSNRGLSQLNRAGYGRVANGGGVQELADELAVELEMP